jgi:hypothetical protein
MGKAHTTEHAIERYIERVCPCTQDEARAALSTDRIRAAIAFGARMIKLGGGQRLIIRDGAIVTITPAEKQSRNWLDRMSRGER